MRRLLTGMVAGALLITAAGTATGSPPLAPTLAWAGQFAGLGPEVVQVAVDEAGNVYATGNFEATADFDPGPGVYELEAAGDVLDIPNTDGFLVKLDSDGGFVWATRFGSVEEDYVRNMTLTSAGDVVVVGTYLWDWTATPGCSPRSDGYPPFDSFVAQFDGDTGACLWAGGLESDVAGDGSFEIVAIGDVVTDDAGNVMTGGGFSGTIDFDPGPGGHYLTAAPGASGYLLTLDPAGNFISVLQTGTGFEEAVMLADGNLIVAGRFSGTVDFDPGPGVFDLTAEFDSSLFLMKLTPVGGFMWAKQIDDGQGVPLLALAETLGGDLALNAKDHLIRRFDADGTLLWAHRIPETEVGGRMGTAAVDAAGSVYVTGSFSGIADFDPGPSVFGLDSAQGMVYVAKLDARGDLVWVVQQAEGGTARGETTAVSSEYVVHTAGGFGGSADFDPGAGTVLLTDVRGGDAYVSTLRQLVCDGVSATIVGTEGPDAIRGTNGGDVIVALAGADRIRGFGGPDLICGNAGDDTLIGGDGNDYLFGGPGVDILRGDAGKDHLEGGVDADALNGGSGRDLLRGDGGDDDLRGGDGADLLVGNAGSDVLRGGPGRDQLRGGGGNDILLGNGGPDVLLGGADSDDLAGGPGVDDLDGGGGSDTCSSGETLVGCEG